MEGFVSNSYVSRLVRRGLAVGMVCTAAVVCRAPVANAVAPTILAQPVSQAVVAGSSTIFVVTSITAPPLNYRWQFNGTNLFGATDSVLVINNVQAANAGSYALVITNAGGSVTSSPAILSVAAPPDFLWARTVTNGVSPNYAAISSANHVAADNAGNVFVAGIFDGFSPASIDFGGGTLTNYVGPFAGSYFLCKYDRFGNFAWARQVATNSLNNYGIMRLATDGAGNVFFAARFTAVAIFGTNTLTSSGPADIFLAKYDPSGQALWARQIVAYDQNYANVLALVVDSNSNVLMSARYTNTANFGSTVVTNSSSFLAKYGSNGNLLWAKPSLTAEALAVGPGDFIFMTGSALNSVATPGLLAKYDSLANLVWSKPFPHGKCIAVDAGENIYVAGWGTGTYDDITITNTGPPDFFIASCDRWGQAKWFRQSGSIAQPLGVGIALDSFGNIFATAGSASAMKDPKLTFGPITLTNAYSFLVKYDPAGNALWAIAPGGTNLAEPYGMALVNHQEIYLAGKFSYHASFGSFNLLDSNPMGQGDFYVAKFAADTTAVVTLAAPQTIFGGTQFQFGVAGIPGVKYAVESSTNLVNWMPISTNTSPFIFSEPVPATGGRRFYRSAVRP